MQEIQTLLKRDSSVLFLAPTGWGKTTLLLELAKRSNKTIVYLSPLRALANEFHLRALQAGLSAFAPKNRKELAQCLRAGMEFRLFVLTAELMYDRAIETMLEDAFIVFDEFHLFYYWGNSFRPALLELYWIVAHAGLPSLLLTATASEEVVDFWKGSSSHNRERYLIDLGNQRIKKEPLKFFWLPKKQWALAHLKLTLPGVKLVFCRYRNEAKELAALYASQGFKTLSCVSGEVEDFQKKLSKDEKIDFIFCTSTLSHGVNLPKIACLYILYRVDNLDLWLQMAGRAGRRGEEFYLVSVDSGNRGRRRRLISLFEFLCHYVFEKADRVYHAIRRDYRPQNRLQRTRPYLQALAKGRHFGVFVLLWRQGRGQKK